MYLMKNKQGKLTRESLFNLKTGLVVEEDMSYKDFKNYLAAKRIPFIETDENVIIMFDKKKLQKQVKDGRKNYFKLRTSFKTGEYIADDIINAMFNEFEEFINDLDEEKILNYLKSIERYGNGEVLCFKYRAYTLSLPSGHFSLTFDYPHVKNGDTTHFKKLKFPAFCVTIEFEESDKTYKKLMPFTHNSYRNERWNRQIYLEKVKRKQMIKEAAY